MTESRTPRPPRPEPIGWGAIEPLAGRAQTIAKGWLLLLLERAPLDAVGAIPAASRAAEGPALCNAVVRALGSDVELARLRADGDLAALVQRVGPLAGATDAAATVAAVDALRACIWSAALDAHAAFAEAAAVRTLADRLGEVTAVVTATAVGASAAAPAAHATAPAAHAAAPAAPPAHPAVHAAAPPTYPAAPVAHPPAPPVAADAQQSPIFPPLDPAHVDAEPEPFAPQHGPGPTGAGPAGTAAPFAAPAYEQRAPAVHDLRGEPEPAADPAAQTHASVTSLPQRPDARQGATGAMDDGDLWIATLERHIDRCQREGGGLALLRVELVDADRVAASAPEGEAGVPYGRLAQAVRRAIRRQDLVASDHQGRAWVIAPGVGRAGAIALAERIGAGVEHGETWRGAPLAATIGFAVYGEDGRDGPTLIDRAEEAMLAATAAGVRIGEAIPQPEGDGGQSGPRLVR